MTGEDVTFERAGDVLKAYFATPEGAGSHPGLVLIQPIGPLAHLGLARAYAMQSDNGKARAAYRDFFELWRDSDPDIPVLKQAQAEFAKLQ